SGHAECSASRIAAIPAGPTRQQPPTSRAPAATQDRTRRGSKELGPCHARAAASQASPLFGYTTTGLPVLSAAALTACSTSEGAQQFTPTAMTESTSAAS